MGGNESWDRRDQKRKSAYESDKHDTSKARLREHSKNRPGYAQTVHDNSKGLCEVFKGQFETTMCSECPINNSCDAYPGK